ncbi:MAG: BCS1 N terminal-domain-containing protein [Benniella sp.]|nr:MAG: BCS1 N terminal-domain-containing protein [Benniella sp.]
MAHQITSMITRIGAGAARGIGLGGNQFAESGIQLAVMGSIFAVMRVVGSYAVEYVKKMIIVTAEFDHGDEAFNWIVNWLSDHPYSNRANQFSVSTTISKTSVYTSALAGSPFRHDVGEEAKTVTYFLPAPGLHFLWYKNRLIWMNRERSSGKLSETITISTIGHSRSLLKSLIFEAQRKYINKDKTRTVIYQADKYGVWKRTRSRPKRPLDTIVMDPELKNYIVNDAKEFFESESWYAERGLPFRRGLLLYGTPGTGKTSFIYALAGELDLNIYVVNLTSKNMTNDSLLDLILAAPSRCLMLIEDVDSAFVQRQSKETAHMVTFSGLLNAIDGVAAQEGRMLCLTTNHIERLDQALIRPGRVDVRVSFGKATQSQAKELFVKFYPHAADTTHPLEGSAQNEKPKEVSDPSLVNGSLVSSKVPLLSTPPYGARLTPRETEALAERFSQAIPDEEFSIAQLQGFLTGYKKTPELAVERIDEWIQVTRAAEASAAAAREIAAAEKAAKAAAKAAKTSAKTEADGSTKAGTDDSSESEADEPAKTVVSVPDRKPHTALQGLLMARGGTPGLAMGRMNEILRSISTAKTVDDPTKTVDDDTNKTVADDPTKTVVGDADMTVVDGPETTN